MSSNVNIYHINHFYDINQQQPPSAAIAKEVKEIDQFFQNCESQNLDSLSDGDLKAYLTRAITQWEYISDSTVAGVKRGLLHYAKITESPIPEGCQPKDFAITVNNEHQILKATHRSTGENWKIAPETFAFIPVTITYIYHTYQTPPQVPPYS